MFCWLIDQLIVIFAYFFDQQKFAVWRYVRDIKLGKADMQVWAWPVGASYYALSRPAGAAV